MHRRSHCKPPSAASQSVSQLGSQPVSYPSMQPLGATKITTTTTTRTLATALDFYRPEVARHIKALPLLSGEMLHLKWREKRRKKEREREGEGAGCRADAEKEFPQTWTLQCTITKATSASYLNFMKINYTKSRYTYIVHIYVCGLDEVRILWRCRIKVVYCYFINIWLAWPFLTGQEISTNIWIIFRSLFLFLLLWMMIYEVTQLRYTLCSA